MGTLALETAIESVVKIYSMAAVSPKILGTLRCISSWRHRKMDRPVAQKALKNSITSSQLI
jgi:hypothetical protein